MRDGSRSGGIAAHRGAARWGIALTILVGCGAIANTARADDVNSPALDDLRRTVEQQQQQIRQLQAQMAGGQQPQAPDGQIQATPAGYMASAAAAAPAANTYDGCVLPPGATVVTNDKTPLNCYWNNGLQAESANKDFTIHVGGRMQWDNGAYDASAASVKELRALNTNGFQDFQDDSYFRRARLRVDGTMYDNIDFVCEFDLVTTIGVVTPKSPLPTTGLTNSTTTNKTNAIDAVGPTDVFCTVKDIPIVGAIRTGSFLYPFSFELTTTDRWIDFIERSAAFDAFVPGSKTANYTLGAMQLDYNEEQTATWRNAISINNDNDTAFGIAMSNDSWAWTGRATCLPYYDEASGGRYLVHLGIDGQAQGLEGDSINYRDRGPVRDGPSGVCPNYVSSTIVGTYSELLGTELVSVWGPWTMESEFYASEVNGSNATGTAKGTDNLFFEGGYVQVMYFLTGENRNYVRTLGAFDRVVPYENFVNLPGERCPCGHGAWQVGARYSWVDLNDQGVHGGIVNEYTVGLNWFLNPNLKYQFNYGYTRATEIGTAKNAEDINGFGMRMVMDF